MPNSALSRHPANHSASLAALAAALSIAAASKAQRIYVDDSAPAGGNGRSWDSPFNDLQDALDALKKLDRWSYPQIKVAQGVYRPGRGSADRASSFFFDRRTTGSATSLEIRGGFAGYGAADPELMNAAFVSVLSADLRGDDTPNFGNRLDNARRIIDIRGLSSLRISGFSIKGVNARDAAEPTVVNSDPVGQTNNVTVSVSECSFYENDVGIAGSVLRIRAGNAYFDSNEFVGNRGNLVDLAPIDQASAGGISFQECIFRNNSGGVLRSSSEVWMGRCWILSNGAWPDSGSSILSSAGSMGLCFIAGNMSPNTWWRASGLARLDQSTVIANAAGGNVSLITAEGGMWVQGSIVWGNPSGAFGTLGVGDGTYLFAEYSDIQQGKLAFDARRGALAWGRGNMDADPRIANLAGTDGDLSTWDDNVVLLSADSPCIDTGDPLVGGEYGDDIFKVRRAVDGNGDSVIAIDIGAVEFQPPPCPADINRDALVDAEDLWLFWRAFENPNIIYGGITADFNHDGFVNGDDWDEFIAAFTAGC